MDTMNAESTTRYGNNSEYMYDGTDSSTYNIKITKHGIIVNHTDSTSTATDNMSYVSDVEQLKREELEKINKFHNKEVLFQNLESLKIKSNYKNIQMKSTKVDKSKLMPLNKFNVKIRNRI